MDKETRELLKELKEELKDMKEDIKDLIAWKNKVMGVFIALSLGCSFLINEIKDRLGIL